VVSFKKKKNNQNKTDFRSVDKGNNLRVQWKVSVQKATFYLHILSTVKFVYLWQAWDCVPLLSSVCFCRINNRRGSPPIPISPLET